jgi:hypothetical protein
MSWAYLRQFPSLVWIVILGTFMVRTTFFMVWPFLSILLYRDYGPSATLIGLILGPRRRFPLSSASMAAVRQMGAAKHPAVTSGVRRQWPCSASPTRWAGWHSLG